jgi:probable rRNA maturation factor
MALRIHNRQRLVVIRTALIKKCLLQIMAYLDCADKDLSVVFASDHLIQALNRTYRQHDRPTNVLAFPQSPTYEGEPAHPLVLGDVVVSLPTAAREAHERRQSLEAYVVYLLAHGLLHLLGYDHEHSPAQRRRMEQRERDILAHLRAQALLPRGDEPL